MSNRCGRQAYWSARPSQENDILLSREYKLPELSQPLPDCQGTNRGARSVRIRECGDRREFVTVNTSTDVYYDPYDVALNADPYPTFRRMRTKRRCTTRPSMTSMR